ncbi:cartilage matrix protein-like [Patella vulgata]|uniref:cartilage matrix protein-like n=1 Tax=Patella vulgata TaxID=6465 RepID=UPI00218062DD|nr:cartilage matrix protein-like [Patella vulgata]
MQYHFKEGYHKYTMLLKVAVALLCVGTITAYDVNLGSILERRNVGGPNMECGNGSPTDIYYVFDPAYLGIERTSWVTQFISHTLSVQEFRHMRIGIISGSCPLDAGFDLNQYSTLSAITERLHFYNQQQLPKLVGSLTTAYSVDEGGRPGARKVAVVFIGGENIDHMAVIRNAQAAREAGVDVYFADAGNADPRLRAALEEDGFRLTGVGAGAKRQANAFIEALCKVPTTPPPAAEECGNGSPTDIYYVFDPAYLGIERTSWVTQFISHTLSVQEFRHMRFGIISGSCPLDAGFDLNQYSTLSAITERLHFYDQQQLPKLVGSLTTAYSVDEGGRPGARKVAVVFIGGEKIDHMAVIRNAQAAREAGVDVYFADAGNADPRLRAALEEDGFRLTGVGAGARRQANAFIEALCKVPTTPPPAAEECGIDKPTDIYFVFEPAYLGISRTAWVTQFITHTVGVQEFLHMRFGIITGSCPSGSGFHLSQYSTISAFMQRLVFYDNPKLTTLIESLTTAYSVDKGGRPGARKVAVVFIGGEKIDDMAVIRSAQAAREAGVEVYFADAGNADTRLLGFSLAGAGAGARRQANAFIEALCSKRYRN